jgi:hypothetical protein
VLVLDGGFSWQDTHYPRCRPWRERSPARCGLLALTQTSGRSGRATAARRRRVCRQRCNPSRVRR